MKRNTQKKPETNSSCIIILALISGYLVPGKVRLLGSKFVVWKLLFIVVICLFQNISRTMQVSMWVKLFSPDNFIWMSFPECLTYMLTGTWRSANRTKSCDTAKLIKEEKKKKAECAHKYPYILWNKRIDVIFIVQAAATIWAFSKRVVFSFLWVTLSSCLLQGE